MSDQRLKDLLTDLASDVPPPDGRVIEAAWRSARRRRRRALVLTAAGTAGALVLGTAIMSGALLRDQEPSPSGPTPSRTPSPNPSQSPSARSGHPDASYGGVPVWWAPDTTAERRLERLDSVLPSSIDLSPARPEVEPGESALGVFTVHGVDSAGLERVIVLTAGGETRELPAEQIEPNADQDGNAGALTPFNGGLSPDGRHLFFAQPSSIELYSFVTATWTTIDTPDWVAEGARWLDAETIWVPDRQVGSGTGTTYQVDGQPRASDVRRTDPDLAITPDDVPYGIWVDSPGALAGSYFLGGPVDGGPYANPEGVLARVGDKMSVLALPIEGRGKGCCPVVGWLSEDVLALESGGRVLAWRVGSDTVYRVADLTGLRPEAERADSSWAWQALR